MKLGVKHFQIVATSLLLMISCRSINHAEKNEGQNDSIVSSNFSNFGARIPKSIGWEFVEIYEYRNHVKAPNGPLKVNPFLKVIKKGHKLEPLSGKESSIYLWVAVDPNRSGTRGLEFRYGPEDPMPGAPAGGTPERPKKAKYGHVTLAGWDPAVSGGEIHFNDNDVVINNDSGRINRFYPDSKGERGAFCDSVKEITKLTGTKFKIVWFDFVAANAAKVGNIDENSPYRVNDPCPK